MAAAVLIPPSPHDHISSMAGVGRRAPLANIPNATNSPHRILTSGSKRTRTQANISLQENEHPHKRLAVDKAGAGPTTPIRYSAEGRVFERGTGTTGSNAFQKRLVAARDRTGLRVTKNVEPEQPKDEALRRWQEHYRKAFPSFSFYFDAVNDADRGYFAKDVLALGAKEEKFFSKSVTHIVTTRPIPPEDGDSTAQDQSRNTSTSVLDKVRQRKDINNHDILLRGRQMNMKIWTTDKFDRVLTTLDQRTSTGTVRESGREQHDLSQALRNDKNGVSEREKPSLLRDLVQFKGPYIYIHDMDERYRPTMVREYKPAARKGQGEWPQFRSAAVGKCPFVEDPHTKRDLEQERARKLVQQRAAQREQEARMQPPRRTSPRKILREVPNPPPATVNPIMLHKRTDSNLSFPPMPSQQDFLRAPGSSLLMSREPAASGIQRSNMTSNIQSNMISSTAATGIKTATSKEVHELKRKVLERTNTGSASIGSIPSSHRMTDLAGALKTARAPAPTRAAKSKAQEKLGGIQEDDEEEFYRQRAASKAGRKRSAQREAKPGYCENCRDKYEDFEEHILSRKHRKFACTHSNWAELDELLAKLQQP